MAVPPPNFGVKSRKQKIRDYIITRTIGNFLFLFAIFGILATFGPAVYHEGEYYVSKIFNVAYTVAEVPKNVSNQLGKIVSEMRRQNPSSQNALAENIIEKIDKPVIVPVSAQFSVVIPKINANEKVVANVDPSNEGEYLNVLQHAVAHAKGTALPGINGTTFLFAHSTDEFWNVGRYNAVFYLLNKMNLGDEVVVFYNGTRYDYKVSETKIIEPTDTQYLDAKLQQGEKLVLQTCWPPGTAWKRLLVFAERVE